MIGFETIGNATVTVFDDIPVLTTDPWIDGMPYFGSWDHAFTIPKDQIENIQKAKYVWLSHGHPDHIDASSFKYIKNSILLIPDHYGDRIFMYFKKRYQCIKLKSNAWFQISNNVRVKSFADWNQDASLLIEILGKDIICNQNDGALLGWSKTIRKIIKNYKNKFILKLLNWGDADMINIYDEDNKFILPKAANKMPIGAAYSRLMKNYGYNYAIPFSSMHSYARSDSFHMNKFCTPIDKFSENFSDKYGELFPAFIRWDSIKEDYQKINCEKKSISPINPIQFGDNYSDQLDKKDKQIIEQYFKSFAHLYKHFGSITFTVGEKDFSIKFSDKKSHLRFETPRNSLIQAVKLQVFDDLLIGNYMKTTLINCKSLYPNFSPYIAKYGDNGFSKTYSQIEKYFYYYKINSADFWRDFFVSKTESTVRDFIGNNNELYNFARRVKQQIV
tara:strand:- start:1737 stop:3074 length:1338 start_codon:yes stop_codon:yes gene_type:complete